MIHYLSTRAERHTVRNFLRTWGRALAPRLRLVSYERLRWGSQVALRTALRVAVARRLSPRARDALLPWRRWVELPATLPRALRAAPAAGADVYVFTDLDRLDAAGLGHAAHLWRLLEARTTRPRLLNHPLRAAGRYELLRILREAGINDFDAYRLTEARRPARFPVFLRSERGHEGSETDLLRTPAELEAAVESLVAAGRPRDERLAVEFRAEPDARGLYRKYAVWRIGGRLVPGHLFVGRHWMLKEPEIVDERLAAEELRFLETNPHAEVLARAFALARIEYGRADYGVVGGRVQVYEINTNPGIASAPALRAGRLRDDADRRFVETFGAAVAALDSTP